MNLLSKLQRENWLRKLRSLAGLLNTTYVSLLLVIYAIALAVWAQNQFDHNRLTQKWDDWRAPTLVALVSAVMFGLAVRNHVALERFSSESSPPPAWQRLLPLLVASFGLALVSLPWFLNNTIRLPGVVVLLCSVALALWALRTRASDRSFSVYRRLFAQKELHIAWEWVLLVAIMALGAFLRLYQLDNNPAELALDQLSKFWDIRSMLLEHKAPVFFEANNGREALFFYLVALLSRFLGLSHMTMKLTSALIGIATILLIYLLARELANREVGLYAAFLLSISKWHIIISRLGYRASLVPALTIMLMYFLVRGLRRGTLLDYGLAGVSLGLGMYTYKSFPAAVPAALSCLVFYSLLRRDKRPLAGAVVMLLLAAIVYAPMGLYAVQHWGVYMHREKLQVGFLQDVYREKGLTALQGYLINLRKTALMFNFTADPIELYNVPLERFFDKLSAILLILGSGYILVRWKRGHNAIPLIFMAWMMQPVIIPMFPPHEQANTLRATGTMAAALLIAALALPAFRRFITGALQSWLRPLAVTMSFVDDRSASSPRPWQFHLNLNTVLTVAIIVAIIPLLWTGLTEDYEAVFRAYPQHQRFAGYPLARKMAEEMVQLFEAIGPVYVKYIPFDSVDVGFIKVYLTSWGQGETWLPDDPNAASGCQVHALTPDQPPFSLDIPRAAFFIYPQDRESLDILRTYYPQHLIYERHRPDGEVAFIVFIGQR